MLKPVLQDLAGIAYALDSRCRQDLHIGTLNDERQYVTAFTTRIRDYWRCRGFPTLLHAQALPPQHERLLGCDAAVLLRLGVGVKIGLFEAKWPRFLKRRYDWDYVPKGGQKSHYSDQLDRQARVAAHVAVWELFMSEGSPGMVSAGLDSWGSTCLWFSEVDTYRATRPNPHAVWTQAEARAAARSVKRRSKHIGTCIRRLAECSIGQPVTPTNGAVPVAMVDGRSLGIPIDGADLATSLAAAARDLGLSSILYADLREPDIHETV